jgi:hypothetical protein
MQTIFQDMVDSWKSPIVARTESGRFSGGVINEHTLANYDSLGIGPEGRLRIGRKICYPTKNLAAWLESRSEIIPKK